VRLIKYFGGYEVEKHGRAGYVVRVGEKENEYMSCWRNFKGKDDLEKLGVGEKIILKWALN
jgi:hypothetical protein